MQITPPTDSDPFATPPTYLTPRELAARWKWHPESCRRWARQRKLAVVKVGRRTLIPVVAIEALERDGHIVASR